LEGSRQRWRFLPRRGISLISHALPSCRGSCTARRYSIEYQPDIHAPVHVKIDLGNKKPVTVFVFESGKILIMAAKKRDNIIDAYNYINKLLTENHDYVVKRNLFQIIANDPELSKLIDLEALSAIVNDL
jgi:TATA-box binding protein (TBP) (component of TFIID and TFIIIB)